MLVEELAQEWEQMWVHALDFLLELASEQQLADA